MSFVKKTNNWLDESTALEKSALAVSIVALLVIFPFAINNFIQGRTVGGLLVLLVSMLCTYNAWICWRGSYSVYLNLFGIVPSITLGCANAILTLGVIGSYWSYLGVFAIYFILPLQPAKYANAVFLATMVVAAWFSLDSAVYLRFSAVLIGSSFFIYMSSREIKKAHNKLKLQSITDPLTGTYNRVLLSERLEKSIQNYAHETVVSTLCVLDIDHFKSINDTYGHDVGDNVLVDLSAFIQSKLNKKDNLFRIGGEEFLILMNKTNVEEATKIADALCSLVESQPLVEGESVTISVGVTEVEAGLNWKEWMKLTDKKLYTAKQNGRNQVVC